MSKTIVAEGKTSTEAIEKGLKELNVTKDRVNIKILEEEKKSFFSILAPRVVKVELTLKDEEPKKVRVPIEQKKIELSEDNFSKVKENVENFLKEFIKSANEDIEYSITCENGIIMVEINGKNTGHLIGYRGESLYAMQTLLSAIANKGIEEKIVLRLDIEKYKSKREQTLKNLAIRTAERVVKTGKSVTLEPMQAYERKIIHSALQDNKKISTDSIGEEPRRRIVIALNK